MPAKMLRVMRDLVDIVVEDIHSDGGSCNAAQLEALQQAYRALAALTDTADTPLALVRLIRLIIHYGFADAYADRLKVLAPELVRCAE
jgi:hypothetical protein